MGCGDAEDSGSFLVVNFTLTFKQLRVPDC